MNQMHSRWTKISHIVFGFWKIGTNLALAQFVTHNALCSLGIAGYEELCDFFTFSFNRG